jgi:hypothetical protein
LKEIISDLYAKRENITKKRIGILQNICKENETEEQQLDIGSLILSNKMIFYNIDAFMSNWKSGNCVILVCKSLMGDLIK